MTSASRVALLAALALAVSVSAATPPMPTISSTFTSGVIGTEVPWSLSAPEQFAGFMATDAEMQNTFVLANESIFDVAFLKLYPTLTQFSYVPLQEKCYADLINDTYFAWFSWLPLAKYNGLHVINTMITDMWTLTTPDGHYLALYNIGNIPVRLVTSNYMRQHTSIVDFFEYKPMQPPSVVFDLPVYCIERSRNDNDVVPTKPTPLPPAEKEKDIHHQIKKLGVMHRVVSSIEQAGLAHKKYAQSEPVPDRFPAKRRLNH